MLEMKTLRIQTTKNEMASSENVTKSLNGWKIQRYYYQMLCMSAFDGISECEVCTAHVVDEVPIQNQRIVEKEMPINNLLCILVLCVSVFHLRTTIVTF